MLIILKPATFFFSTLPLFFWTRSKLRSQISAPIKAAVPQCLWVLTSLKELEMQPVYPLTHARSNLPASVFVWASKRVSAETKLVQICENWVQLCLAWFLPLLYSPLVQTSIREDRRSFWEFSSSGQFMTQIELNLSLGLYYYCHYLCCCQNPKSLFKVCVCVCVSICTLLKECLCVPSASLFAS